MDADGCRWMQMDADGCRRLIICTSGPKIQRHARKMQPRKMRTTCFATAKEAFMNVARGNYEACPMKETRCV